MVDGRDSVKRMSMPSILPGSLSDTHNEALSRSCGSSCN
jgi:hypothetical protein